MIYQIISDNFACPYKEFIKKSGMLIFSVYNKTIEKDKKVFKFMQTLVRETVKPTRAEDTTDSSIQYFLSKLEQADPKKKSEIENIMVNIGSRAVPELVNQLQLVQGTIRGVVAMTLIRIGEDSIECLKRAAMANKDFEWIAKYLINEITISEIA